LTSSICRENPDLFRQACRNKRANVDVDHVLELDSRLRQVKTELQDIATQKNQAWQEHRQAARRPEPKQVIAQMSQFKQREAQLAA